jgi:hypothetical protein
MKIWMLIIIGLYYIVFSRFIYNVINLNMNKDILFLITVFVGFGIYKFFAKSDK